MHLVLREWEGGTKTISSSAFTQARAKFKHTAFIELLEKAVINVMYKDGNYERYKGYRLLALDGSSLRLPNTAEIRAKFGVITHLNGNRTDHSAQVEAKATVLYDALNKIPISAMLHKGRSSDRVASKIHLPLLEKKDILIADRGFGSYQFFAEIISQKANFIIRCREKLHPMIDAMFKDESCKETVCELLSPKQVSLLKSFPKKLSIRLIRIPLDSGEVEVLATSLMDKETFPYLEFKKLYFKRWKIETYFNVLKSRLCIDNFTGKTVEAVYQDFYSTIFVSGFETIVTAQANEALDDKDTEHRYQVNKAISFHAIKSKVVEMIFDPPPDFDEQLLNLFMLNPTAIRENRPSPPRSHTIKGPNRRSLFFQRYYKKHIF